MNIIKAQNLSKHFIRGTETVRAVDDVSFEIKQGESVAILGASGSGKTTLINLLGCLDNPTSGTLEVNGQKIFEENKKLGETELTKVRRKNFGYIFQKFFLIPTLSVKENILLPFLFSQTDKDVSKNLKEISSWLGIEHRLNHLPSELSGGEAQRTAIARALITKPPVLIADEPTGNLDTKRTEEIGSLLARLNKEHKITMIIVTHNPLFTQFTSRTAEMRDGKLKFNEKLK